jgi:hypothetical protein
LLHRVREIRARHQGKGGRSHCRIVHGFIHQHGTGAPQLQGGRVQVSDRALPRLLADRRSVREQLGHHDVE